MAEDNSMELKKNILNELKKISSYLAILSLDSTTKLIHGLKKADVLTTKQRVDMFLLIDGERTTQEIAKKAKIGERGAQLFIKELFEKQLVQLQKKGNSYIPVKNYEKIIETIQSLAGGEKSNG